MTDWKKFPEWNARPQMTPEEFAKWQAAWQARELAEQYGLQCVTRKIIGAIHDELIIPADELSLGNDFDKWFLGQLKISAEDL